MQHVTTVAAPRRKATVSAYINLMKPHVTVLLLGVTLAAMAVAASGALKLWVTLATMAGGALAAGSANAINCYWDRDIDQIMSRTRGRTLPAGRVPERHALIFGLTVGALSVLVFGLFVNWLSALLALSAILFYVGIYTMWLKRSTPQNIVIGGAAGAVPVLIGWAAVTNSVAWPAIWMFVIIFLWTPPHFWALSLVLKKDYERAGVPMLPVVRGEAETYKQILLYTVVLGASTIPLFVMHTLGGLYLALALALGVGLLTLAVRLYRTRTLANARQFFWFSNYYLALIFAAMVVDKVLR
ncbi:MAG: Heme O synthase, protoheme IX farnesyltransferase, COX10-CtaB [Ktedonobacterales bacterium]|jgi:protoheme IX farnesyltransferase|nr:MAG: Heme O synthase, protoheme IX farnesyltransferase, COX10-CtaB [Ktedonobacterales bacterium]